MSPTTRSQSAKAEPSTGSTADSTGTDNSDTQISSAYLTLPLTTAQLSALDPHLFCKSKSSVPATSLPVEEINQLHSLARSASPDVLKNAITLRCLGVGTESHSLLSKMGVLPAGVLLLAIDPVTGNSLLHSAISARRVDNADLLMGLFGPEMGHSGSRPTLGRNIAIRKLFWHANRKGDTFLHTAVRTGDLVTVVGAYRVFCGSELDDLVNDENGKEQEDEDYVDMGPDNDMDVAGGGDGLSDKTEDVDETTWEAWYGAAEWVEKLLFVIARNAAGKTAEDIARELGHQKIVVWLGRLANKLDPKGRRESQEEIDRMQRFMTWSNYQDEDGPERNRREEEAFRKFSQARVDR
ncbi:hypothetical protein V8F20_008586 [Naviculisporaceae sp. PSN 640]